MRNFLILTLLLATPTLANACREIKIAPELRFSRADTVLVGRISGVTLSELEDPIDRRDDNKALLASALGNRILRLSVIQTLKGDPVNIQVINWSFCGSGIGELSRRVIAYRSAGAWYLEADPDSMYPLKGPESVPN